MYGTIKLLLRGSRGLIEEHISHNSTWRLNITIQGQVSTAAQWIAKVPQLCESRNWIARSITAWTNSGQRTNLLHMPIHPSAVRTNYIYIYLLLAFRLMKASCCCKEGWRLHQYINGEISVPVFQRAHQELRSHFPRNLTLRAKWREIVFLWL